MGKREQVLLVEPQNVLEFQGPFTTPITSHIKLSNPTNKRVAFKIKTTAPKKYCVRPNAGILENGDEVVVAVCLQPFPFNTTDRQKHKFMVQSIIIPEGDVNMESLWRVADRNSLMDTKLKCAFLVPEYSICSQVRDAVLSTQITGDSKKEETSEPPNEVKRLREEGSNLRQENMELQQEIVKLRTKMRPCDLALLRQGDMVCRERSPIFSLIFYFFFSMAIGALGYIMGKYIIV